LAGATLVGAWAICSVKARESETRARAAARLPPPRRGRALLNDSLLRMTIREARAPQP
jgi:hypothetical protein